MNYQNEIQKINKEIKKALEEGAHATIKSLETMKKGFEKQLQLGELKRDSFGEANNMVEEVKVILAREERIFDNFQSEIKNSVLAKLEYSFESKTGEQARDELVKKQEKVRKKIEQDYQEIRKSCKVKVL